MQRTVLDWYLKIDENEILYSNMNRLLMEASIGLFISGSPQSGKTHFLKEIEQRIEGFSLSKRKSTKMVLYFTGDSLHNMLQFVSSQKKERYKLSGRSSNTQIVPPAETKEPFIIIDDIHRYPFHSQGACVLLNNFLSRSQSIIVTSNLPFADLGSGSIFADFNEISLLPPSITSAKRILEEFIKQHQITRISKSMLEVCLELYSENAVTLSELKQILYKCKFLAENKVGSTLHDENFPTLFVPLQMEKEVGKRIRNKLIIKEKIMQESLNKKRSESNEQDQGTTL